MTKLKLLQTAIGLMLAASVHAQAPQVQTDLEPLFNAYKFAEVESVARARGDANPRDDVAWWYLALVVAEDPKKRAALLPKVESCAENLPQSAKCQHARSTLYVAHVETLGMSAALKYASRIKSGFERAVELEPRNFVMRRDLVLFYLQAPGIAGGSVRKATEQVEDFGRLDPLRARLMRAEVHVYEKEWDQAEASLMFPTTPSDAVFADQLAASKMNLGFALINDKRAARARKSFQEATALSPASALAHMGLGRALLADKQVDAAITSLERAVALNAKIGAHYRLGLAYELKGDRSKAIAALDQFLSYRPTGSNADDARKRISSLKQGGTS